MWVGFVTATAAFIAALLLYWSSNILGFLLLHKKKLKTSSQLTTLLPSHWFWGNLIDAQPNEEYHRKWLTWIQTNRLKIHVMWFGPFYMQVGLNHPDAVKKVIKEPKNMLMYRLLTPWLGDGLLVSSGKKWFRNRRLLTPAFHYEILKPYVPVYNSCVEVMLTKWTVSAKETKPVKLFETLGLLSLDILLQCSFSYKSDCQNTSTKHPYISAVYDMLRHAVERFMNPLYHIDFIYWLTLSGRRMKENCKFVHEFSEGIIRERKKSLCILEGQGDDRDAALKRASNERKYLDFLDILLTAVDEDGKGLTDLEIRNEVDTFLFEGHDTTTSGMSFTLYCLAKHPEHQEKVREEVRSVLMGREKLEYEDLKELKYTQWCIKEAMRLYPPVMDLSRKLSKDVEIEGVLIPKGMNVSINITSLHRHPDVWSNPNEYDPLRFHPSNVEGRDPYAYMPFSAGYRNCIGQNFALNEEKLVIASIVNCFDLSLVQDHVERLFTGVLRTANDILVNLRPVNNY